MHERRWCVAVAGLLLLLTLDVEAQSSSTSSSRIEGANAQAADPFPSTFYRYRGKGGRWVFTNIAEQVPSDQRGKARLDLSHITLNSQLGAELDASMQQEFEVLSSTPECKQAVALAQSWWRPLWDEYNYLIILLGVFLALVLATPYALKRIDAPTWARTLTKAFAMLGFVALFMHTSMRAGKTYQSLRSTAEPCQRETWTRYDGKPNATPNKLKVLVDLQKLLRDAEQNRLDQLDTLLK